jgi:hypothetical protein
MSCVQMAGGGVLVLLPQDDTRSEAEKRGMSAVTNRVIESPYGGEV